MDHRLIEGLMEAIAPVIRESTVAAIDKATAPLLARITELEIKTVERGQKGEKGDAGKDADPALIAQMVADEIAKIPPAPAGKDASPELVAELIGQQLEAAIASLPKPENGKDADPALIAQMVSGEIRQQIAALDFPPGQKGEPGKDADPPSDEQVAKAVTEYLKHNPPKDGRDGRDASDLPMLKGFIADQVIASVGTLFETISFATPDDGRTMVFAAEFNGKSISHEIKTALVLDCGVWRQAGHVKGDGVTHGGSFWIAQRDTDAEPDTADSGWRLSVKRGRPGRDFRPDDHARSSEPVRFR